MQIGRIDITKLRGIADKGLGLAKELVGALLGNERLEEEGEAQQARASEQLKALRKEIEAQRKESEAEVHEQRQRAAQKAKAS
jgi:uncharacterized protein YjbJ (UPF0337 family)